MTLARAEHAYPDNLEMQRKYLAAIHWMRSRPGGSIWCLDNQRCPKWAAIPLEMQ